MVVDYGKARLALLEEEIGLFDDMEILPIQKLTGTLTSVGQAIADLKAKLKEYPFPDRAAEIEFFKNIKPRFIACQLYALDVFTIESNKPTESESALKAYYEQELKFIRGFFDKHQFIYQYYLLNITDMDACFFVRGAEPSGILMVDAQEAGPEFSTRADYLFAKFISCERTRDFLVQRLSQPEGLQGFTPPSKKKGMLKWTGDAINLVELAYGIWLTGQVNNGNAGIAEIVQWLEINFQISIGRPFRRWQSISSRKRVSQVKYLDQMRGAILRRLDDENL